MRVSLIVALIVAAFATARGETLPLSLQKAVELALAPNGAVRVQLAEESIKAAAARASQARAGLLPNLDGSVAYRSQTTNLGAFGIQFPLIPGFQIPQVVGPFQVFDARANASQSVFDFSAIKRFQAGRVGVEAAKADNQATRDQVSDDVARAYLSALRAETARETQNANIELSEALLRLARSQKDAGTGTGIEITRAQVQLANDRQRGVVAQNDVERAHLQLLKIIGLKLDVTPQLTDRMTYQPVDPSESAAALETARRQRAELNAQQKREDTARLNYSAVKSERLPSVGIFADYGAIGHSAPDAEPTYTYGVSVKLPLFDGGRRDARRAESLSQLRQEQIRTRDLRDQVELEVRLALKSLEAAEAQIVAAKEGLQLAENELAQARRRYEGGVANSIEVTDAQTRLQRARDNQIAALYNHNLARIELATATGKIQKTVSKSTSGPGR